MVLISDKVLNFAENRGFCGIVLKKEMNKFGWAGCVDIIRGEFIKSEEEINKDIFYNVEEYKNIKVFIPENIDNSLEIRIKSNLSFFNMMILSVDVFEK